MSTINFVSIPHANIYTLADVIGKSANQYWLADVIETAKVNGAFSGSPDLWVSLKADYLNDLRKAPDHNTLSPMAALVHGGIISEKVAQNYAILSANALVMAIGGKCTSEYFAGATLQTMADDGLKLLETSGQSGGFVAGHTVGGQRSKKLADSGINPVTGLKFEGNQAAEYADKQKKRREKAATEKAVKLVENAKVPVAKVDPTTQSKVAKLASLKGRIEVAIDPKNAKTPAGGKLALVALLEEVLKVING